MSHKCLFRSNPTIVAHRSLLLLLPLALSFGMACDSSDAPTDSDQDGVTDRLDAFPNDPTETEDGDGVGDRLDAFPEDSAKTSYASEGPYVVGVPTLSLGDRELEVFYPAEDGSQDGVELASYDLIDPFPRTSRI